MLRDEQPRRWCSIHWHVHGRLLETQLPGEVAERLGLGGVDALARFGGDEALRGEIAGKYGAEQSDRAQHEQHVPHSREERPAEYRSHADGAEAERCSTIARLAGPTVLRPEPFVLGPEQVDLRAEVLESVRLLVRSRLTLG